MPELADEDDSKCRWIYPEDHEKAGQQCAGNHIKGSAFCHGHSGGVAQHYALMSKKAAASAALKESLEGDYHELKTREQVRNFTEKVINGVMQGVIKKDRAAPLAVFLPLAWNQAKNLGDAGGTEPGFQEMKVSITNKNVVNIKMSPEDAERFLNARGPEAAKILEDLQSNGQVETVQGSGKDDGVINVIAKDITPETVKIDATELSKITKGTEMPCTPKQIKRIFGRNMAGDVPAEIEKDVDLPLGIGFDDLFSGKEEALPLEAQSRPHRYEINYIDEDSLGIKVSKRWYICKWCGFKSAAFNQLTCPKPQHYDEAK